MASLGSRHWERDGWEREQGKGCWESYCYGNKVVSLQINTAGIMAMNRMARIVLDPIRTYACTRTARTGVRVTAVKLWLCCTFVERVLFPAGYDEDRGLDGSLYGFCEQTKRSGTCTFVGVQYILSAVYEDLGLTVLTRTYELRQWKAFGNRINSLNDNIDSRQSTLLIPLPTEGRWMTVPLGKAARHVNIQAPLIWCSEKPAALRAQSWGVE